MNTGYLDLPMMFEGTLDPPLELANARGPGRQTNPRFLGRGRGDGANGWVVR